MRRRRDPRHDTDLDSVYFACCNGLTTNPMYRRCEICTREICSVRDRLKIDRIIRDQPTDFTIGLPYDPEDLQQDSQFLKYFNWIIDRPNDYDVMIQCIYKELPRDPNGRLFCQQFCPILKSREFYCTIAAKEMVARDGDKHCRQMIADRAPGWEKIFVDPETGYYTDDQSKRPKNPADEWREIRIGMTVVAVICFLAWLMN